MRDEHIWATTMSSLNAVDVRAWTRQREQINSQKCKSALTVTTVGAGSVVKKIFDASTR